MCQGEAHRSERVAQCLQSRSCACPRWGRSEAPRSTAHGGRINRCVNRCFKHSVTGARCGGASDASGTSRCERGPGGGLCSRGFGARTELPRGECEYEPTQRPLPPPLPTTCDVASASSRSSTAGSSTPQQGHGLSRLLTTTLSLRATSPSGKRCIPSLWSSASRRSPPADLRTGSPSGGPHSP